MLTKKEAFSKAMEQIKSRRLNAKITADQRYKEISEKIPEFLALQRTLASVNKKLSMAIFDKSADTAKAIEKIKQENLSCQAKLNALLTEHGYDTDYLIPPYFCKKCQDTGFVSGRRCACLNQLISRLSNDELSKTAPTGDISFANFDVNYYPKEKMENGVSPYELMCRNYKFCVSYAENFSTKSQSILMLGNTGLGKTHLSLAIAKQAIKQGYGVVYGSVVDFIRDINNEQFGKDSENDTLKMLVNADLVILDDLGAEFETSFSTSALYSIINTRQNSGLPTIINTNLTPKELEQRYKDRIVSRLFTGFKVLRFAGKDIRQLKINENR